MMEDYNHLVILPSCIINTKDTMGLIDSGRIACHGALSSGSDPYVYNPLTHELCDHPHGVKFQNPACPIRPLVNGSAILKGPDTCATLNLNVAGNCRNRRRMMSGQVRSGGHDAA